MGKYKRHYKVVVMLRGYTTDNDKYDTGEVVKIKDLENISFEEVLRDLNKRLINMDCLGTNIELEIANEDARTIIDSYSIYDNVDNIEIPGQLKIEISSIKVTPSELDDFVDGVLEIVKATDSKVLAIGYTIDRHGKFKLVNENEKKNNTIIIEFIVKKIKEI